MTGFPVRERKAFGMKRARKYAKRKQNTQISDSMMRTAYIFGGGLVIAVLGMITFSVVTGKGGNRNVRAAGGTDYAASRLEIWEGENVPPADSFLYDSTRQLVSDVRYLVVPEQKNGDQDVAIVMQLNDGTTRTENAVLAVKELVLHYEIGSDTTAQELLGRGFEDAELSKPLKEFSAIGSYPLTVTNNGREKEFTLVVQDTVAPVLSFKSDLNFYTHQKLSVMDFIQSCEDKSTVEYHFSEDPNTMTEGIHEVTVIATDAAGNSTEAEVEYMVSGDGEPPVISGTEEMHTIAGIPVSYLRGVTAEDSSDGEVAVTAEEPENFSYRKAGTYVITYTAEDKSGNVATATANLVVLPAVTDVEKLTSDDVFRVGDKIIEGIRQNTNEKDQKVYARAIYNYVQEHMFYSDNKDILDWQHAAIMAIYNGYGDCRNYYAFARLLLTCADFENMTVEKVKTAEWQNNHYWNLVRINGAWYHFDTTPRFDVSDFFMWTDAQMDNYSARNQDCFNRDKSLYPATPTN